MPFCAAPATGSKGSAVVTHENEVLTIGSTINLATEVTTEVNREAKKQQTTVAFLHTCIGHNPKVYVREVDPTDSQKLESRVSNVHTISFRIVVKHEYKYKQRKVKEERKYKELEDQQIQLEVCYSGTACAAACACGAAEPTPVAFSMLNGLIC